MRRTILAHGAWIDVRPGWIGGADALFDRLARAVPWHAERRHMYDHMVDVPRLLAAAPLRGPRGLGAAVRVPGVPVPDEPFPRVNDMADFERNTRGKLLPMLLRRSG